MREDRAALARVQQALRDEVRRIAARAENDYQIAQQSEKGARSVYAERRRAADKLNDKTIEYVILQKEASESQALYQSLLTKLREAGVLAGLRSSNLTVLEPATPPSRPSSPKTLLYLAAGLGLGIFCGLGAAIVVDLVDNRIHSAQDIEQLEMPVLGLIPTMQAKQPASPVPLLEAAQSPMAKQYDDCAPRFCYRKAWNRRKWCWSQAAAHAREKALSRSIWRLRSPR